MIKRQHLNADTDSSSNSEEGDKYSQATTATMSAASKSATVADAAAPYNCCGYDLWCGTMRAFRAGAMSKRIIRFCERCANGVAELPAGCPVVPVAVGHSRMVTCIFSRRTITTLT